MTFEILPGLPPYGPPALPFPESGYHAFSEGLVVRFDTATNGVWTGNFQRGLSKFDKVIAHPNSRYVIVISGGDGYVIDPELQKAVQKFGGYLTYFESLREPEMFLFGDNNSFSAFGRDGELWSSGRLSWDGFRDILCDGSTLRAEAYSPMGDLWYPFELDLLTGIATDAIYPLEMATAARIK